MALFKLVGTMGRQSAFEIPYQLTALEDMGDKEGRELEAFSPI